MQLLIIGGLLLLFIPQSILVFRNIKNFYFLSILSFVYLGYFALMSKISFINVIFYDLFLIIPFYLKFLISYQNKIIEKIKEFKNYKNIILTIIFFVFFCVLNLFRFDDNHFLIKIIGLKVWIFYVPLFIITFYIFENKKQIHKFFISFVLIGTIPLLVLISLYFATYLSSHRDVLNFFYFGNNYAEQGSSQGYIEFIYPGGLKMYRFASTFVSAGSLSGFLILYLFSITFLLFNKSFNKKILYQLLFLLFLLACFVSGLRIMVLFIPLYFILYSIFSLNLMTIVFLLVSVFLLNAFLILLDISLLGYATYLINYIYYIQIHYGYALQDLIHSNFFGNGLGMATNASRAVNFIYNDVIFDVNNARYANESFYAKTINEIGFIGFFLLILFYLSIYYDIFKKKFYYANKNILSLFLSFLTLIIIGSLKGWTIDIFPLSFSFWIFLGIILKYLLISKKCTNSSRP